MLDFLPMKNEPFVLLFLQKWIAIFINYSIDYITGNSFSQCYSAKRKELERRGLDSNKRRTTNYINLHARV